MYKELFIASTDTLLGLGAPISKNNEEAIFRIKKRSKDKKLVIMVSSIDQLKTLISVDASFVEWQKQYWPGQTTIIYKSIAYRIPDKKELLELIEKLGPIYMTSANISGQPTLTMEQARKAFPEINNFYDFDNGTFKGSVIIEYATKKIFRK